MNNNYFDMFETAEFYTHCNRMLEDNETVDQIDGSFYCGDCTKQCGDIPMSFGEFLVLNGISRLIANPEKFNHIPHSINKISLAYKEPIVWEEIDIRCYVQVGILRILSK